MARYTTTIASPWADLLLGLAFERIGDKAAAGMVEALDGEKLR